MALRSISRAGMDVAGRVAGKGRAGAVTHRNLGGAERMMSSFVGQGHFGRSQASPYRQGSLGAGTQLFKLVETDLMSKELTRYGPSDAEPLGLYAVHDVLADIAAAASALREPAVAVSNAPPAEKENASVSSKEELAPAPSTGEEDVLAAWGLGPRVMDTTEGEGLEAPASEEVSEKMAIKRTYQPSTLKRKRKHGFLYRAKTRLGKKIMQRRQEKGRWRLGI